MPRSSARSGRPPPRLHTSSLEALALRYVGRYATTRTKLTTYLDRKLRERGWDGERAADPAAIAERCVALGYIDDHGYALAKAESLTRRGFGARRVRERLRADGIGAPDAEEANNVAATASPAAALALARRRRIGPFADAAPGRDEIRRAINILVRAGHDFSLARRIANAKPGEDFYDE